MRINIKRLNKIYASLIFPLLSIINITFLSEKLSANLQAKELDCFAFNLVSPNLLSCMHSKKARNDEKRTYRLTSAVEYTRYEFLVYQVLHVFYGASSQRKLLIL